MKAFARPIEVTVKVLVVVLVILGFWRIRVLRSRPPPYESPPRAGNQREALEDLTLEERSARDQRIAAGVVTRWKKRGLI
jgi:hypothetical protein